MEGGGRHSEPGLGGRVGLRHHHPERGGGKVKVEGAGALLRALWGGGRGLPGCARPYLAVRPQHGGPGVVGRRLGVG